MALGVGVFCFTSDTVAQYVYLTVHVLNRQGESMRGVHAGDPDGLFRTHNVLPRATSLNLTLDLLDLLGTLYCQYWNLHFLLIAPSCNAYMLTCLIELCHKIFA
jgi:hypothetical protein